MRKLKTSTKTFLSVTLVSIFILSFISYAQAVTFPSSYHLHKGTTVGGNINDVFYEDGYTLDIRLRRRGWINYFYEIIADFIVPPAEYEEIAIKFDHNIGSALLKITVVYWDEEMVVVAWDSKGELHTHGINENKVLHYIRISYNKWTTTKTNYYVYIDLVTASP